jgi:uncharacterized protein Yka (UPF0111/DUF47 family)
MRATLPFDTHAYVKRLTAAGMPEAQADVQAEALAELVLSQVATKADLRQAVEGLEQRIDQAAERLDQRIDQAAERLDQRIDQTVERLEHRIDSVELRLGNRLESALRQQLLWFFGMLVVLAGGLTALLRMFFSVP